MEGFKTFLAIYGISTAVYGISISEYQSVSYEKDLSIYLSDGMCKRFVMKTIAAIRGPFIAPIHLYEFLTK